MITTLRSWKVRIDETFFLGGIAKVEVLRVLKPHIFFDDQTEHLEAAASAVPSGHVPREQLELLPAEQLPPQEPKRVRSARQAKPAEKAPVDAVPTAGAPPARRRRAVYPSTDADGSPETPKAKEARRPQARAKPR